MTIRARTDYRFHYFFSVSPPDTEGNPYDSFFGEVSPNEPLVPPPTTGCAGGREPALPALFLVLMVLMGLRARYSTTSPSHGKP